MHLLAGYDQDLAGRNAPAAQRILLEALAGCTEQDWLECARALVFRNNLDGAAAILSAALLKYPQSIDARLALAGIFQQTQQLAPAESLLHALLAQHPDHDGASFLLARMLMDQGRSHAAARVLRALFSRGRHDIDLVIQAVELLDEGGRQQDAAAICEAEIDAGSTDARLHAYAGMLQIQLGEFERARQRYLFAIAHDTRALEWNTPIGLSSLQRYKNDSHPDFQLFRDGLRPSDLDDRARAALLFALGKAHDDIGDLASAAGYLRQANATVHAVTHWSRKHWRRAIEARIASKPLPCRLQPALGWTPIFIVGVPRSGTTLVAELLSRYANVCNRGELKWLPKLAEQLSLVDHANPTLFEQAAAIYQAQLRQDDSDAHWFIDKQPLNLTRIDLILALWPNARIIHCQRNARDTALSLWSQCFTEAEMRFAYDFADIAAVIQGCRRLMAHWQTHHAGSIHTVCYEQLASDPATCIATLVAWLGLPADDTRETQRNATAISTGSLWQARQPVYARSVERWRGYAPYLPELLRLPAD